MNQWACSCLPRERGRADSTSISITRYTFTSCLCKTKGHFFYDNFATAMTSFFPLFGFCLLFSLSECKLNEVRPHRDVLREFLIAQPTPESQELAKAVCKVECLRDCLNTLQAKTNKDNMAKAVLEELRKTPVNVQSECRRLSPAYLFYNEWKAGTRRLARAVAASQYRTYMTSRASPLSS
ncbi:hypothetical protein ECG_06720 [Echinococcus granulosus]|nr:hypothetical protein ECG_06720 [Echinococcus granulosus]